MLRRLFALLAATSTVLCMAVLLLWVRGGGTGEHWIFVRDLADNAKIANRPSQHNWDITLAKGVALSWKTSDWTRWHYRQLTISYSVAAVTLAMLPMAWMAVRWQQFRRKFPGHCVVCGYDLRATPNRCPECGAVRKPA